LTVEGSELSVATLIAVQRGGEDREAINLVGKLVVRCETLFGVVKGTKVVVAKVRAVCILKGIWLVTF
jgi:hypothetical protein